MDYFRYALATSQRAPIQLIVALAFSTLVGAALLVRLSSTLCSTC